MWSTVGISSKFWGSKAIRRFSIAEAAGLVPLTPVLFKGQQYSQV